ncbi:MAG TPA: NADH-quinone oxidoreductase subunit NuoE [Actinomycetes bacterium]|nr:NADH-quinone oxidoreductase subunit NuoE [Actinomycetes bacterium]
MSSTPTAFAPEVRERLVADAAEIIARYPRSRSALLPMLHLVQAEEGYVSPHGIELCAELLDITAAEVAAVATFYTMYKRRPNGEYSVGVCTNTLCAVMGGDQIFAALKEHLGIGHDETTEDGKVTLEHLECNAACDYAPVMMVNWEFFDNQTPESAKKLVDDLQAGELPTPTRGASLCTFRQVSRVLAGFPDGRADEGPSAGPATLAGLEIHREQTSAGKRRRTAGSTSPSTSGNGGSGTGYGAQGGPSGDDAPASTAESDDANATPAAKDGDA